MNIDNRSERQISIRDLEVAGAAEVCVEGVVERIVFESKDTGFLVGALLLEGGEAGRSFGGRDVAEAGVSAGHVGKPTVTFVGAGLAVSVGETVRLWGRWVEDKKFGRQLRVHRYQTVQPATVSAIEKYLGSGLIAGIGPAFAKRLVGAFGLETLRVIEEEPERLRSVPGIGAQRAGLIREAWAAQRSIQSIMMFLQDHGIANAQAARIYKKYGDVALAVLRDNPYQLAEDIAGISFRSADAIAEKLGIGKDSEKRVAAGLLHVLRSAAREGHVYLKREALVTEASALLGVDAERVASPLLSLAQAGQIVQEQELFYLPALHKAESGVAQALKRLLSTAVEPVPIDVEKAIAWVEKEFKIGLSEEQREAIRVAVQAKVMVITGGPGTGKTTLLNSVLGIFARKGLSILLAAPTGRAAKRMETATGREAKTLHRLLEWSPKAGGFLRHEGNPLSADLVIVDECSMVDVYLMHALARALAPQARLILVGDVDQLPSVGPGNVLMDVIASQTVPAVWLKTVFRQAAESGIVSNAHRINSGQLPEFNEKDFYFIERNDPEKVVETVIELVVNRIPAKFGLDAIHQVQALAPMHRGDAGVSRLNEALREALNGTGARIPGRAFGVRDKVMQLRNNYELDVYNGDIGIVTHYEEELRETQVRFEERTVLYGADDLDELTLAYAGTVHKSQGSEYAAVVLPLLPQHFMMLQRNVLYTAITRARALVVIVGDAKAVTMAVRNTQVTRRNTRLAERLGNRGGL